MALQDPRGLQLLRPSYARKHESLFTGSYVARLLVHFQIDIRRKFAERKEVNVWRTTSPGRHTYPSLEQEVRSKYPEESIEVIASA
jgi:phosphoribosyl-ATP pyrophosphohydrolase